MKHSMNTAQFFIASTSEDFRKRYFGDLTNLFSDYIIDEQSKAEIAKIKLDALTNLLSDEKTPDFGEDVAKHTLDSHTQHTKDDHVKSSHDDDRGMYGEFDWSKLVSKYGEKVNDGNFAATVIKRHK